MIDIVNVTKRYGPKVAVQDLTLSVPAGELVAFLGPNGAGKTTTIKMLCGLLFPTAGTVRVGGCDVVTQGDRARQLISYVPDQPFLYEKLTGREFLQFVADLYGMPRDRAAARMQRVTDLFGLGEVVADLTAPVPQGVLFQRLRWRVTRNAGTQLFGNSRMRLVSMVLSSVVVWFAVFGVAYYGFGRLVEDQIPPIILELLFNAMFVTLGGM